MAFRNAQQARIYVGPLAASAFTRTLSVDAPTDVLDVTVLTDTAKQFITGQDTSTFSIGGPLDSDGAATGQLAQLAALRGAATPTPITYMPLGTEGATWVLESISTNLTDTAGVTSTVDWAMTAQTTGITDMNGVVLSNNENITATQNGAAIDGGAATSNGASFNLHVTTFTSITSDAITIEDSSTGSSGWATIATFTTATGLTSQHLTITGTIKRYVRVVDTIVGTGSITRHIAMARR